MRDETAAAGFGGGEGGIFFAKQTDDDFLHAFTGGGDELITEVLADEGVCFFESIFAAKATQVNVDLLAKPIPDFSHPRKGLEGISDSVCNHALAKSVKGPGSTCRCGLGRAGNCHDPRQNQFFEHGVEFARGAREEEEVRKVILGWQVESGCSSGRIGEQGGTFRDQALPSIVVGHGVTATFHIRGQRGDEVLVDPEGEIIESGGDFAGHVVRGRPESAGGDDDVSAPRCFKRLADWITVRDSYLTGQSEADRAEFSSDVGSVGIDDLTEQELGSGIDQFDVHVARSTGEAPRAKRECLTCMQACMHVRWSKNQP